ncbi:putative patatin-like phospholipase [Burkholderia pseudomallei]|nr:putative patatin-like phospholipase [Burkholderia pseudomallei]
MLGKPLFDRFDLVYGTSTGAIIASLIALGYKVDEIHDLYRAHVPTIMSKSGARKKTAALAYLANEVFGSKSFSEFKIDIGIVTTRWLTEKPMIFKANPSHAHGRKATFTPGFGVCIADAVQASCSAYPFFERKIVVTASGDSVELIDGGYCANNPTLYAIADAVGPLGRQRKDIRIVSVGVGEYPEPKATFKMRLLKKLVSVQLLQKTLEINTQSMDQLRSILFNDVATIRISDAFTTPEMATDLMEHDLEKLNILRQRGVESFAQHEGDLREFLL